MCDDSGSVVGAAVMVVGGGVGLVVLVLPTLPVWLLVLSLLLLLALVS